MTEFVHAKYDWSPQTENRLALSLSQKHYVWHENLISTWSKSPTRQTHRFVE